MYASFRSPWRVVLGALLLGALADQLVIGRWPGLAVPLWVLLALVALFALGRAEHVAATPANTWLGAAALLFASFVALRATPALVFLDVVAVLGLLVLLVAFYRSHALARLPLLAALGRVCRTCVFSLVEPIQLAQQALALGLPLRGGLLRRMFPFLRGLLIAAPLLLCFGWLLSAADATFSAYLSRIFTLTLPLQFDTLVWHSFAAVVLAWVCAGALAVAICTPPLAVAHPPAEGETQRLDQQGAGLRFLGWVESITVLGLVDALFAAFMLVQAGYLFGGLDTLQRSEMTYADYARRGFAELVVVACMSLWLLWASYMVSHRAPGRQRMLFDGACVVMVVLLIGMLCSAFQRMLLYEQAYGFTELRLYTQSFMVWLGALLVLFVVALVREQPRAFVWGGLASALVVLAVLNLANPEQLIVRANLQRYHDIGKLDHYYLTRLSADAYPALVDALPTLPSDTQGEIMCELALHRGHLADMVADGWRGWNLARSRGLAALEAVVPPGEAARCGWELP
ncbi:DUF4173 domain-containing protein [Chloroflexia bacterium SDU3-3]|nr:DUF4173 domain-containing protein [Chloroflexia bacterium SDU3-3]